MLEGGLVSARLPSLCNLTVLKSGLCSHFYVNQPISECLIEFSFRFVGRIYIDKNDEEPVVR